MDILWAVCLVLCAASVHSQAITDVAVILSSPNFMGNPPTFTLFGDSNGGLPEFFTWRRNEVVIVNNASFSFTQQVLVSTNPITYRSTLNVTGVLPGAYRYAATNDATSSSVVETLIIQGGVSQGRAVQTGLDQSIPYSNIFSAWTQSSPPSQRYQLTFGNGSTRMFVDRTNVGLDIVDLFGPTNVTIVPVLEDGTLPEITMHYGLIPHQVNYTIRGVYAPTVTVSSLTATAANISWALQEFSFSAQQYTLTVSRVPGSSQPMCNDVTDVRSPILTTSDTTRSFTSLEESSVYRIIHNTLFNFSVPNIAPTVVRLFGTTTDNQMVDMTFTTPSAVPTGAPRNMAPPVVTSRRITVTWEAIDCRLQNGVITGYAVEFQRQGAATDISVIPGTTFDADGLTPGVTYTFRVAGNNSAGRGLFTNLITRTTDEEAPGRVSNFVVQLMFTTVLFTWGAPVEPNGVITRYVVTYRVNSSDPVMMESMDLATLR